MVKKLLEIRVLKNGNEAKVEMRDTCNAYAASSFDREGDDGSNFSFIFMLLYVYMGSISSIVPEVLNAN